MRRRLIRWISGVGLSKFWSLVESVAHRLLINIFTCSKTPEESVKEDMKAIKNDPYLPKGLEVIGFVHDTFKGTTTEVGVM